MHRAADKYARQSNSSLDIDNTTADQLSADGEKNAALSPDELDGWKARWDDASQCFYSEPRRRRAEGQLLQSP